MAKSAGGRFEMCSPHTVLNAYLLILPLTAILYVAANEQPDVTSRQLNSLALATGSGMQYEALLPSTIR